jgi:hypothetical protein
MTISPFKIGNGERTIAPLVNPRQSHFCDSWIVVREARYGIRATVNERHSIV